MQIKSSFLTKLGYNFSPLSVGILELCINSYRFSLPWQEFFGSQLLDVYQDRLMSYHCLIEQTLNLKICADICKRKWSVTHFPRILLGPF